MAQTYDFIIVGGGTAGCLLASRLSRSPRHPTVLLLEAGVNPSGEYLSAPFHRYAALPMRPDLNYDYVSTPEPQLNNRSIGYARGKGLGGSSILNFGLYLYGSREDYNRWGSIVGDEEWAWDSVKKSFGRIETYGFEAAKEYRHLADPSRNPHGTEGDLKIGLPAVLEKGVVEQLESLVKQGERLNLDVNSRDPVGVGIWPSSYGKEGRSTSAIAHLLDPPRNLEVWTDAKGGRLVWEGTRVVGVVTEDGREVGANTMSAYAKKEVIICGGSIDSPKLLLLNGIGPKAELEALGIDVKVDLPGVGKQLHDHLLTFMTVEVSGSINDRYSFETNEKLIAEAEEAWKLDHSGAFALQNSVLWGAFLKLDGLEEMEEYKALPQDIQDFLSRDAVPHYEFINNGLLWPPGTKLGEGNTYLTFIAFLMNPQSRGSVTLSSSSPADKPVIQLNYLTHPYDRRVMSHAIKQTWSKITSNPVVASHIVKTIVGPKTLEDGDVEDFMREHVSTVWHAGGTCRMGKQGDEGAVVDSNCRVLGVEGLRVVDMSVAPLSTNNHTQGTAYLIGQKAAEKLVAEYGLDKV